MPAQERPLAVDGQNRVGDEPLKEGWHREAMERKASPHGSQASGPPAAMQPPHWDGRDWSHEHEEAAGHRARQLLSRSDSNFRRVADKLAAVRRWLAGARWVRRLAIAAASLFVVFGAGFFALWWRLGAGPINLDVVTPWLAAAIQRNIGNGNTVEVGGTQIERAGRIRIAVRIRDIVVRDRDHAIVASAPKAEVKLSGAALLMGQLRAESLNLVDAKLSVRISPDGYVTVSAGDTAKPLATGIASTRANANATAAGQPRTPTQVARSPTATAPAPASGGNGGLLAGLSWLDSLSLTGLDGQNLKEIGLKNGSLVVDDEQRGNKWDFPNISLSLRRPYGGGVAFSLGEGGTHPWSLQVEVGPSKGGLRRVAIRADKVPTSTILLALRPKDLTYSANLALTGELHGELGRDGLPTYFSGQIVTGAGTIVDSDTPDYPMAINSAEMNVEWNAERRVLVAPFKIISGANRITLLARLEPPNQHVRDWQLGLSGGTIVLGGIDDAPPLIFNHIAVDFRFDTARKRVLLTQADIGNGKVGIAGNGRLDYSGEPLLKLGLASTAMSASDMKRLWPTLIVPRVRQWVIERIESGSIQRIEVGIDTLVKDLPRSGPPIPDDGLSINIVANDVTVHPVDGLPAVHDADLIAHVTGRTATVTIGQATANTPAGRKVTISDFVFRVPDTHPKPPLAQVKLKMDGPVSAAAELLASDRLRDLSAVPIDPNTSKGTFSATLNFGMPVTGELTRANTTYTVTADLSGFSADKLVMGQKLEANTLKITANNQGYEVKGDVKVSGQVATLDYYKPADGDAAIKLRTTLDDAGRARFGLDLGPAVSGEIPIKMSGTLAGPDHGSRLGIEADLTPLKLDNLLPGWVKLPGKPTKATFNVVPQAQSTKFEDIVIAGAGVSIKGSLEVDQNGNLMKANFPTYSPSEGDKASLKAERGADGVLKVTMRGDVFDARGFLKSAISDTGPTEGDSKGKFTNPDLDVDLKLAAVAGYNGEAVRGVHLKLSRRKDVIKSFSLSGKIGRDTPLTGELRHRGPKLGRNLIFLDTKDAGAFFRFSNIYSKMVGGQLELAMDPPAADSRPKEGLMNVRNFSVKGEPALDRLVAGGANGAKKTVSFWRLRAEFTRQNGKLTVNEGVVKGPTVGATIEGSIDYVANKVRMSGTFVPLYGLNNMFGQIPVLGLFLGGGSDEGLIGITYEVIGSPAAPVVRINPISAMAPGVLRKIFQFNTGKPQQNQFELPPNN